MEEKKRWLVVMNCKAGTAARAQLGGEDVEGALGKLLEEAGVEGQVFCPEPADIQNVTRAELEKGEWDAVIAAGGDGTVTSIVEVLLERREREGDAPALGILPLGTFNHSAKELGVPLDWNQAVRALATAEMSRMGVGRVNGAEHSVRVFLNFATVGLHPEMVKDRDERLKKSGGVRKWLGKWPAMAMAALKVLARFNRLRVQLRTEGVDATVRTPGVYFCRNRNLLREFGIESGDGGEGQQDLTVLVSKATTRRRTVWLFLMAAIGRLPNAGDFEVISTRQAEMRFRRPYYVAMAIDGEHVRLRTPVEVELIPGGIRVLRVRPGSGNVTREAENVVVTSRIGTDS